jgi:integrase
LAVPSNTLAATTGASTKELMTRMGHASLRVALIYQHATQERDKVIADALSEQISRAVEEAGPKVTPLRPSLGDV